jgi:pre-rRNA-processing protein TSR2
MSVLPTILPIIRSVFSRWTALQLSVNHSMGGSESEVKYEAFIEAFGEYLTKNIRSLNESDIQEYLDEILDEEFNTVLDDDSSRELGQLFVRYIHLILEGKLNDIQQELQVQESSESEDDTIEEEEETTTKTQSMDIDEDGWTTVHRRIGGKK